MKQLWAPWRMDYIQGGSPAEGCVFCLGDKAAEDASRLVLARGATACVLMNRFPYSNGHLLIAPYRHTADLADLDEAEVLEMHGLLRRSQQILAARVGAQGFQYRHEPRPDCRGRRHRASALAHRAALERRY